MSQYRFRCYELEGELRAINLELYQAYQKIDRQQQRLNKIEAENIGLRKELAGTKEKLHQQPKVLPTFVKANVPKGKPRLQPDRKVGHPAALRPMPENIDKPSAAPPQPKRLIHSFPKIRAPSSRFGISATPRHILVAA